jgi:AbrB family looped-hinge helix DNA binding protein
LSGRGGAIGACLDRHRDDLVALQVLDYDKGLAPIQIRSEDTGGLGLPAGRNEPELVDTVCGYRRETAETDQDVAMNPAGRVTVPAEVRRTLGLDEEAFFEVEVQKGAIVLRPVAVVPLEQARAYQPNRRRAS